MTRPIEQHTALQLQSTRMIDALGDEDGASVEDRTDFLTAVSKSEPAVVQLVSDIALDELMREARPWGSQTCEERIAQGRAAAAREDSAARWRGGSRGLWGGLAAAAVVLLGVGIALFTHGNDEGSWKRYASTAQSAELVVLEDGTQVTLSAGTEIEAQFGERGREVRLSRGEALFKVHRDVDRPFRVQMPRVTVEVVGTQFTVRADRGQEEISVVEGHVKVSRREGGGPVQDLFAGDRASFLAGGQLSLALKTSGSSGSAAGTAELNRLFEHASLVEIAEAYNRHGGRKIFEVAGSACARRISTELNLGDPDDLIGEIQASPALVLEKQGDVMVIRGSRDAAGIEERCH